MVDDEPMRITWRWQLTKKFGAQRCPTPAVQIDTNLHINRQVAFPRFSPHPQTMSQPGGDIQERIAAARREAEVLKEKIRASREASADTSRMFIPSIFFFDQSP